MKKKDIIVIVVLLVVIGVGYLVFSMMQGKKDVVEVYYKDELIEKIDISVDKTYTFKGSYGKFSLEVKNHEYHAVNVECPNHDCEKMDGLKKEVLNLLFVFQMKYMLFKQEMKIRFNEK